MLENDPYQTPKAVVLDVDSAKNLKRRPKRVWIIMVFFSFGVIFVALSFWTTMTGSVEVTPELERYFDSLNILDYMVTILTLAIELMAIVTLFRMRVSAVRYWRWLLYINIFSYSYTLIFKRSWREAVSAGGLFGAFIGVGLIAVIVAYTRNLEKKGALS